MKNIRAVLFDLDGTLVDTEKYYRICWPKAFEHFGYAMSDQQYLSIRSLGKPFVQKKLKEFSGDPDFDYGSVVEYRSQLMRECLEENGLELKKGASEVLDFLNVKGIVCAVVTASPVERAMSYLECTGLSEKFDRVISARDMKEGKPSPDCYEFACRELGLDPENCMAVEDSPNGVTSAWKAGCNVVMVPDLTEPDEETIDMVMAVKKDLLGIRELFN